MTGFLRDLLQTLRSPCRALAVLLSQRTDTKLPAGVRVGLRLHVVYCGGCRLWARQVVRLRALAAGLASRTLKTLDSGESLPSDVRDRLAARLGRADRS